MRPLRRSPKSPIRSRNYSRDSPLLKKDHSTSSTGTPPKSATPEPPSPLHLPSPRAQYHAPPKPSSSTQQQQNKGWKTKLKTFFKRGHHDTSKKKEQNGSVSGRKEKPLSKSKDEDVIQFTQSIDEFDDEEPILSTPTATSTTPSTLPATTLSQSRSAESRKGQSARPTPFTSPSMIPAAASFSESPKKTVADKAMKRSRTAPEYRLGAAPLSMGDTTDVHKQLQQSILQRTSTPQTASTQTTKKTTESSLESQDNTLLASMKAGATNATASAALQPQSAATTAYQNFFSCGPSLLQTAAACISHNAYPDPDIPALEDSSVSSTSAEAEAVVRHESSEERRQRLWKTTGRGSNSSTAAQVSLQEEEGMELIFFQEDEDDWSQFPWSQRMQQTEKVDKDIFLSFTEMGFDEVHEKMQRDKKSRSMERLAPVPETTTISSGQEDHTSPSETASSTVRRTHVSSTPPRTGDYQTPKMQQSTSASQPPSKEPIPLARTGPMPSPDRSDLNESIATDQVAAVTMERKEPAVVDRSAAVVDRVSSIMKSVPNVFAKLAQSATTGPSSESQILLTRSSSQVTWVSHADDFAALDARPLTEIVIPTTPESESKPGVSSSNAGVSTVQAIRNAIFDSIERGESEHKEGEDEDLDAPLQERPESPPNLADLSSSPPLLLSPSSLTFDSRYVPPLSDVPVRVPSDGEEHPQGPAPQGVAGGRPMVSAATAPNMPGGLAPVSPPAHSQDATLDFTEYDDISDFDDGLSLDDSPPPGPTYQPQPDTPGERRSLMPPRSMTMSASTFEDEESIGLNALSSPERKIVARKLSSDFYRHDMPKQPSLRPAPPTPPRKQNSTAFGLRNMVDTSWDYSGLDMSLPNLTHSDGDSDSSSENIDHLLLSQRQPIPTPSEIQTSYEDASQSSIVDDVRIRTFSGNGFDLDSVVETEIDEGTGLFSCACWEIPPLIEQKRNGGGWQRRERREGLLEDRVRSDDDYDDRRPRKGIARKMINIARSTSNSFKSIWSRRSQAEV